MPKYACPICGDPDAYPLWVGAEAPDGCPQDKSWGNGGPVKIKTMAECPYQMGKARQRAAWMKMFPKQFDQAGKLKDGGLVQILERLPSGTKLII